ncbi:branched-chain amino acid ABC transporter permease [Natrialba sp. INN-245]|uniref:branched-chain amino acid ABC transporter permease n=1 Tax=Natrialba sp. INN-245 TaxID=2690967 RepID=UPI00131002D2|nr:branched-chain amino acid ABC transporter permease [Natrialba sp. INN-245]MWV41758.1 hypothetical protein [Natrialba sp. INN-245]
MSRFEMLERMVDNRLFDTIKAHRTTVGAVVVAIAVLIPFLVPSALLFDLTLVFIYGMLAFSAILPIGYAGQLILAQGAFFGVGAYSFVKLTEAGLPPVVAILIATAFTGAVAYLLGKPATRASGIYLGIITLAFNELFVNFLELFPDFTGGSTGLSAPSLFPSVMTAMIPGDVLYYYLLLLVYIGTVVFFYRLLHSEFGWALLTIKEDPVLAESIGIDAQRYRLLSFTSAGLICGLAGGLFAPFNGYLSPPMFDLHRTIDIILAGVAGGLTTPIGSIFGGLIVVLVPEFLRFIAEIRLIIYGVLLILLLMYLPEGIGGWLREKWEQ